MSGCEAHSCKEVERWWLLPISFLCQPILSTLLGVFTLALPGQPELCSAILVFLGASHSQCHSVSLYDDLLWECQEHFVQGGLKARLWLCFKSCTSLYVSFVCVIETPLFWCGQHSFLPDGWGSPHGAIEHHTSLPAPLSTMSGLGWNFALLTQVPFLSFGALGCEYAIVAQRELGKNVLGKIGSDGWEERGNRLYKVNASHKCVGGIVPVRTSVHAWGFCGFGKCAWLRGQMEAETSWCSTCQAALWHVLTQGRGHLEGQETSSFMGRISPSGMQSA